jgi:hypothetical protein
MDQAKVLFCGHVDEFIHTNDRIKNGASTTQAVAELRDLAEGFASDANRFQQAVDGADSAKAHELAQAITAEADLFASSTAGTPGTLSDVFDRVNLAFHAFPTGFCSSSPAP